MSTVEFLTSFLHFQEERVAAYHRLETSFRTMIETKKEVPFLEIIPELTQRFGNISKEIITLEQQLNQVRPFLSVSKGV